jgi:hypothetical protein
MNLLLSRSLDALNVPDAVVLGLSMCYLWLVVTDFSLREAGRRSGGFSTVA